MQTWEKVKTHADLILESQNLAVHAAKCYAKNNADFKDLVQEGIIGLIDAVEKYDPNRGIQFKTMAYHWVKKRVQQAFFLRGVIQTPIYLKWKNKLVDDVQWLLQQQRAEINFIPYDICEDLLTIPPSQYTYLRTKEKKDAIRNALGELSETEYSALYYYYRDELTLQAIGEKLNVTKQAVNLMLLRSIQKIRRHIVFANLKRKFGLDKPQQNNAYTNK